MNNRLKTNRFDWCQLIYWNNFLNQKLYFETCMDQLKEFINENPTNDNYLIIKMVNQLSNMKLLCVNSNTWDVAFPIFRDAWKEVLLSKIEK